MIATRATTRKTILAQLIDFAFGESEFTRPIEFGPSDLIRSIFYACLLISPFVLIACGLPWSGMVAAAVAGLCSPIAFFRAFT